MTKPNPELSELELMVLGLIWNGQPMTPYAVRKSLATSPSSHWSGSSGAVYPLVRRLKTAGLIKSTPASDGQRAKELLSITPTGVNQLEGWLRLPVPDSVTSFPYDPVRTRMLFLGVLPPDEALATLRETVAGMDQSLADHQQELEDLPDDADQFLRLAMDGALSVMRVRIDWVRRVIKQLEQLPRRDH